MGGIDFAWQQTASDTPNAAFRKIEVRVLRPNDAQTITTLSAYVVQAIGEPQ
jgi:hypothetical protein